MFIYIYEVEGVRTLTKESASRPGPLGTGVVSPRLWFEITDAART